MTSDIPVTSDEQRSVAYSMTKLGRQLVAGLGEPSPSRRPDKIGIAASGGASAGLSVVTSITYLGNRIWPERLPCADGLQPTNI